MIKKSYCYIWLIYVVGTLCVIFFLILENSQLRQLNKSPHVKYRKSQDAIDLEVMKVRSGDGDAAINLSKYYEFEEGDFVAAYFWAVQAHNLKHSEATDEVITAMQNGVFSAILSRNSGASPRDKSHFYSELPDIESEPAPDKGK